LPQLARCLVAEPCSPQTWGADWRCTEESGHTRWALFIVAFEVTTDDSEM
jgi:hypothetical protein